jgi:hypothetical protein
VTGFEAGRTRDRASDSATGPASSGCGRRLIIYFSGNVLHEIFNAAVEEGAQAIHGISAGAVSPLVEDLRQGHPVQARCGCYFANGQSASGLELPLLHQFSQPEANHDDNKQRTIKKTIK